MKHTVHDTQVVVIGAGLSGLAAAQALSQRNIPVIVLDASERIGESWRLRHPQLRLNIHRHFASLPGREITHSDGIFLRRDTVVDYLELYADNLAAPIHKGVSVSGIERAETGWCVTSTEGSYRCSDVVIATGRDRNSYIPAWRGRDGFRGELLHAADLGDVTRFDGKRVLVVGAGNSGTDVLNHLSRQNPAQLWVSVRHGPAIVPTRVFGFPLHRLARLFAALPARLLDPAFRLTQRLFLGKLSRFGLQSHPDGGGTRLLRDGIAFAIDDGFIKALRRGRITMVPEVVALDCEQVLFADSSRVTPDVVICATGYRNGLAALLGELDVLDATGQPLYPMGEADPANPGLWFTGFKPIFTGFFDAAGIAAKRIADGIEVTCANEQPRSSQHAIGEAAFATSDMSIGATRRQGSVSTDGRSC